MYFNSLTFLAGKFSDTCIYRPWQTAQTRVYTICHSIHTFWTNFSMERPFRLNFRVITVNVLAVGKRTFTVSYLVLVAPVYMAKPGA